MTEIINFYGGPGAGKSTMALKLMGHMKDHRMNVEYVPEVAKSLTWEDRQKCLDDQVWVFAQQQHMLYALIGKVDFIVTDSPLLLSLHYVKGSQSKFGPERFLMRTESIVGVYGEQCKREMWEQSFRSMVIRTSNYYKNINFLVKRGDRKYVQAGRNQDEAGARKIDENLNTLLIKHAEFDTVSTLEDVLNVLRDKWKVNIDD